MPNNDISVVGSYTLIMYNVTIKNGSEVVFNKSYTSGTKLSSVLNDNDLYNYLNSLGVSFSYIDILYNGSVANGNMTIDKDMILTINIIELGKSVGDVAYWDGSKVMTTPYSSYSTSLGTAIGVVVIPKGFAPDGKTRILSLKNITSKNWASSMTNTSLTNYTKVPTTDNYGSTSTGSSTAGYLPSDNFTNTQSYIDSKVKYTGNTPFIPSPYLGNEPNSEYYKTISGNNALSDFNGLTNTQTLVSLGTGYKAANAAWNYNDGVSNLQWYLPGAGEIGYLIVRIKEINNILKNISSAESISTSSFYQTSTEYDSAYAYAAYTINGLIDWGQGKDNTSHYLRCFATIG